MARIDKRQEMWSMTIALKDACPHFKINIKSLQQEIVKFRQSIPATDWSRWSELFLLVHKIRMMVDFKFKKKPDLQALNKNNWLSKETLRCLTDLLASEDGRIEEMFINWQCRVN